MKQLEKIKDIFIVDRGPAYETVPSPSDSNSVPANEDTPIIIEGRILPKAEPYCQRSFRLTLTVKEQYPFNAPYLRFLDSVYHPNVGRDGKICMDITDRFGLYNPTKTFASIIEGLVAILSSTNFNETYVINGNAYQEYHYDRDKFNQIVLDYVLRFGSPRP